jgi:opacity protein-like surface antigen
MKKWIVLSALFAQVAFAQLGEISLSIGQSAFADTEIGRLTQQTVPGGPIETTLVNLENRWRFALRLTLNTYRFFGHEFGYGYNRTGLAITGAETQGMAAHQGFYNFLAYALPEGSVVRPFATGGVHFSNFVWPGTTAMFGAGDNKFGYNYGGGVKVRVTPVWGIRLDFREYITGKPFDLPNQQGRLRHREIAGGLSFLF